MSDSSRRARFVKAFLSSVLGTGLSRVMGAIRDIVVANFLGAGAMSDAFYVAYTVPNVFRRFVADEGLTGALIPALSKAETEDPASLRPLANAVFTALILANIVICIAGMLGAEWLVKAFAYAYVDDPEKFELTVNMTRWMFPFVAMVSFVSFFEGLLNFRGHFFVPKLAPALVSAGIAGSAILLGTQFEKPVYALVVGVLVGGLAHVLVNLPWIWRLWGPLRLSLDLNSPRLHAILRELGKVILIGIFAQINILILRQLAAALQDGAVTHYYVANRLVDLFQGVVAVAIGSALLPNVSQAVAQEQWAQFRSDLVGAIRLAAFLLLPAAAILLAFSTPVTAILFRHGAFSWDDTQATALTLQLLVPFMLSVASINILKKVYFALDDRMTLLGVGAVGVLMTGGLGWMLVESMGIAGLALALSASTGIQLMIYVWVLRVRLGTHLGLTELTWPLARMATASLPAFVLLRMVSSLGQWEFGPLSPTNLALVIGGFLGAGLSYGAASKALHIAEFDAIWRRLSHRFR
jgi:putative peptidoglycan lipid II flippase